MVPWNSIYMVRLIVAQSILKLLGTCSVLIGGLYLFIFSGCCQPGLLMHVYLFNICSTGNKGNPLDWESRLKIAIGTARGLRYLHEDCRVGCILHRDLRPHNILLTHDFEPQVWWLTQIALRVDFVSSMWRLYYVSWECYILLRMNYHCLPFYSIMDNSS